MIKSSLQTLDLPNLSGLQIGKYKIEKNLDEGGFGIAYKALDTTMNNYVAIKFLKNLADSKWIEEAKKAAKLQNVSQIATVYECNEVDKIINGKKISLRYIVWEYVEGQTLENFLNSNGPISTTAIVSMATELCMGIAAMTDVGLEHGDLHPRNIMIVPPKHYDPWKRHSIKILDFGLAQSHRDQKHVHDMEYLQIILLECWNKNQYYHNESLVPDKKFHQLLTDMINRMEDPNLERRLNNPTDTMRRIHDILEQSQTEETKQNIPLKTPFEFTSAEEMPEDSDLLSALYTDTVPWLKEITNFGTMIISGPRGSGKSMILKNMRLLTKLASYNFSKKSFQDEKYFGFYIHCHQNLYIPFAGTSIKNDNKNTQEKFVHYLNLLFTSEILQSIILLEERKFIFLSPDTKYDIGKFLETNIFQGKLREEFLTPDTMLQELKSTIEKEILLAQRKIVTNKTIKKMTRVKYLSDLVTFFNSKSVFSNSKPVYFLLDDYSDPKIPFSIQKSLNRIIGFRNNKFCFKITTEKFGFISEDLDGKILEHDREYSYLDLGGRYVKYNTTERKEFIKEIIHRRLKRSGISLSPDEFFGTRFHKNIAEALMIEKQGKKKKETRVRYSGFDTIYRLCMGDVGTILMLCRDIYAMGMAKNKNLDVCIDVKVQDKVIRDFSKRRLDMIKEMPVFGERLYQLVEVFGEISKKYLYEYSKFGGSSYREVLRIDLIESTGCLSKKYQELFNKLISQHIFLDAGTAYPLGKGISNVQLILRPIYTPVLKISYTNRFAARMSCKQLEGFLKNPEKFSKEGNKFLTLVNEDGTLVDSKSTTLDSYTKQSEEN